MICILALRFLGEKARHQEIYLQTAPRTDGRNVKRTLGNKTLEESAIGCQGHMALQG